MTSLGLLLVSAPKIEDKQLELLSLFQSKALAEKRFYFVVCLNEEVYNSLSLYLNSEVFYNNEGDWIDYNHPMTVNIAKTSPYTYLMSDESIILLGSKNSRGDLIEANFIQANPGSIELHQ